MNTAKRQSKRPNRHARLKRKATAVSLGVLLSAFAAVAATSPSTGTSTSQQAATPPPALAAGQVQPASGLLQSASRQTAASQPMQRVRTRQS
jgi:hypothetical protein